ncbi:Ubiquitin-conjugating enzyme, E2 [Sesbania bispinosa]|nr:Ubiquitin-conjugating enzyme, E2 [Sesbania bispinosa]
MGKETEEQRRPGVTKVSGDNALVTQKELRQLLQNRHDPQNAVFDLEPPLTNAIMTTPYPNGYQLPIFSKFDGTGGAKEHLMSFLDDLGIHRNNKDLRLKEFLRKRSKETEGMFDVCVAEGREKKAFRNGRTSGGAAAYNTNELPPVPLARAQICQLVEEWLKHGTLRPRMDKPPLTNEQYDDQAYCILHKANSHTVMECWNIRRAFHKQVKMEIAEDADTEEGVLAVGLSKTRGFKVLFGQLGMGHDAQREATKAFIHIVKKWGGDLSAVVETLGRVHAMLEVGPIKTTNIFQIAEGDSSYHLLLGRPWIHLHQCVPSTLQQCIKSNFKGKDIEIPGVRAPFEAIKAHLIDASLFDEVAPPGSSAIEIRKEIPLQGENKFIKRNDVYHSTQALKRPKMRRTTVIEKEYLPNGEVRWRVL